MVGCASRRLNKELDDGVQGPVSVFFVSSNFTTWQIHQSTPLKKQTPTSPPLCVLVDVTWSCSVQGNMPVSNGNLS